MRFERKQGNELQFYNFMDKIKNKLKENELIE